MKSSQINDTVIETKYSPKSAIGKSKFKKQTSWNCNLDDTAYHIELWATTAGRAGTENKYDFPPPVDNDLFYGSCLLVNKDEQTNKVKNLTKEIWEKIYEKLFGGFENLNTEEEPSEDELETIPEDMKTSSGYLKDGFVVENDSSNDNSLDEDDSEESAKSSGIDSSNDSELDSESYDYSDDE